MKKCIAISYIIHLFLFFIIKDVSILDIKDNRSKKDIVKINFIKIKDKNILTKISPVNSLNVIRQDKSVKENPIIESKLKMSGKTNNEIQVKKKQKKEKDSDNKKLSEQNNNSEVIKKKINTNTILKNEVLNKKAKDHKTEETRDYKINISNELNKIIDNKKTGNDYNTKKEFIIEKENNKRFDVDFSHLLKNVKTEIDKKNKIRARKGSEAENDESLVIDENNSELEYKILNKAIPKYPKMAIKIGLKQDVEIKVEFLVSKDKKIKRIKMNSNFPEYKKFGFEEEILKVINSYRFSDFLYRNSKVSVRFNKRYIFNSPF